MNLSAGDQGFGLRVLLLTPTAGDSKVASEILRCAGTEAIPCDSLLSLCRKVEEGAGAILIAEEAISTSERIHLIETLAAQEPWSDLPVIILTTGEDGGHSTTLITNLFDSVGNMVLLERPFRAATLVATVQVALRARRKQYEVRNLLISEGKAKEERQAAQEALSEALQRFEFSIDAAEIGTFFCPVPLGDIFWNDKCCEHFWLPPGATVDFELFYSILHPDDRNPTKEAVEEAVKNRKRYDVQYRTVAPDGRFRWVRAKGRAYYGEDGNPTRFDGITIDITAQKELEDEREQLLSDEKAARAEAERVSRMKDEFLATLSHEVRTPLNAIFGWVQILKRGRLDSEAIAEGIEIIDRNVRLQTQLIEDLLDMSRIISGKVRLDATRVNVNTVIDAAFDAIKPTADTKGVKLRKVLDPLAGPVTGDPARLQQIIWNLVTNAIKFTPKGGRVEVLLERVNSHVEISVTDNGAGIQPDFLPHIFERFMQADASTTRQHGGLGLGLAIVKNLVELHGGEVRAKSAGIGKGSTFIVQLPVRATEADESVRREHPRVHKEVPVQEAFPKLAGIRVLVVDDDADARNLVQRLLRDCDAEPILAGSADEAENLVAEFKPDVIISDIGMPGRDGFDFIRSIRQAGVRTPAIALTAFARSDDRIRSIQAGYQTHIPKPVEPAELLAVVASLAGRY